MNMVCYENRSVTNVVCCERVLLGACSVMSVVCYEQVCFERTPMYTHLYYVKHTRNGAACEIC